MGKLSVKRRGATTFGMSVDGLTEIFQEQMRAQQIPNAENEGVKHKNIQGGKGEMLLQFVVDRGRRERRQQRNRGRRGS